MADDTRKGGGALGSNLVMKVIRWQGASPMSPGLGLGAWGMGAMLGNLW